MIKIDVDKAITELESKKEEEKRLKKNLELDKQNIAK